MAEEQSFHDRKIFIGGVNADTTSDDLSGHFGQYGQVKNVTIKYDQTTGRSRGFAFVEFAEKSSVNDALNARYQDIKGKRVEVKRVTQRENKKIFVGGVSAFLSEDDIKNYFQQFGAIEEVQLPIDQNSGKRRNFCFVIFQDDESAEKAAKTQKHFVGDRWCDVKKATPFKPNDGPGGDGGGGGGGGGRGYWGGQQGGGGGAGGGGGYGGDAGAGAGYPGGVPEYGTPAYYQYYQAWYNYYYGGGGQGAQAAPQGGGYAPPQQGSAPYGAGSGAPQGYAGSGGWGGGTRGGYGGAPGYSQNGWNR